MTSKLTLEKLLRGAATGIAALAIISSTPDYSGIHNLSYAQEIKSDGIVYGMQANGYTFDYNPNGWPIPQLDEARQRIIEPGYTKVEKWQKWADKIKDIHGEETFLEGYLKENGQVVTTYKLDNRIYAINFNSFKNEPLITYSNINPSNRDYEKAFKYRYKGIGGLCPDPVRKQ